MVVLLQNHHHHQAKNHTQKEKSSKMYTKEIVGREGIFNIFFTVDYYHYYHNY